MLGKRGTDDPEGTASINKLMRLEMSAGTFLELSIVLSVTLNLISPNPWENCVENCDTPLIDPSSETDNGKVLCLDI